MRTIESEPEVRLETVLSFALRISDSRGLLLFCDARGGPAVGVDAMTFFLGFGLGMICGACTAVVFLCVLAMARDSR
jgi:hypothetical protein